MAKNTVNATMRTSKQQISKILMSQLVSGVKEALKWYDPEYVKEHNIEFQIVHSNAYANKCITSWHHSDAFAFRFEYGRKTRAVRVSYMNSDGLTSAIFSKDEWECMTSFIEDRLNSIIDQRVEDIKREKEEREERDFQRRVDDAVRVALARECEYNRNNEKSDVEQAIMKQKIIRSSKPWGDELY